MKSIDDCVAEIHKLGRDGKGLLRELFPHKERFRGIEKKLRNGIFLWTMTSITQEILADGRALAGTVSGPSEIPSHIRQAMSKEVLERCSLTYRTYTSLVYMRSDLVASILKSIVGKGPQLTAYSELFATNEIRKLRNALAHGTFELESNDLHFVDECEQGGPYHGRVSFKTLDHLNYLIFGLWLSLWACSMAPKDASEANL